ncbi:FHA domain-containing protein [Agromyces mediolanus]|uniref:FHA domain-containing protein n=1 Tax=Agromyces mediolanus TaxID=41986 RepID=UPI0038342521
MRSVHVNCRICDAELPEGAMFCGECGSSTSATPESRRKPDPRPGDTTIVAPLQRRNSGVISIPVGGFLAPDGRAGSEETVAEAPEASRPPVGETPVAGANGSPGDGDRAAGESDRFRLRFSTGETRIVFGTGLIGRKPLPQPGERFDHLVQIADRTLSVSKTHLEFGSHDGVLWISDRFSGNGTMVRRPDDGAVRCEPGRRYQVPRGSTIELAQQQFIVD